MFVPAKKQVNEIQQIRENTIARKNEQVFVRIERKQPKSDDIISIEPQTVPRIFHGHKLL